MLPVLSLKSNTDRGAVRTMKKYRPPFFMIEHVVSFNDNRPHFVAVFPAITYGLLK